MIEKILVAIDGSKNAYKALDYAIRLALDYEAELFLLTVVPDFKPKCDEESAYQRMLVERAESYLGSAKEEVEEILEAVEAVPSERVIILPNFI